MPSNSDIADHLKLLGQLTELHGGNPFKAKAYLNAAFRIDKLDHDLHKMAPLQMETVAGLGKGTVDRVVELISSGTIAELEKMVAQTPPGIMQMLTIKGLGPKKTSVIWKELGIESTGELLYACNENRLVELKGFGQKTQEQIRKAIEFTLASAGRFHYAAAERPALTLLGHLEKSGLVHTVSLTGDMRRCNEVVERIEILAATGLPGETIAGSLRELHTFLNPETVTSGGPFISAETFDGIPVSLRLCGEKQFAAELFLSTGSTAHLEKLKAKYGPGFLPQLPASEEEIYQSLNLPYMEPELREGEYELEKDFKPLLTLPDLKGILHNHTKYSDGLHTLAEMARYCKELGYEYLGICDHSQSAFYASGLKPETVLQQFREIDQLNAQLAPFKIFKGIESDILSDGSLDYPEELLAQFDFIVASIHSNLKMDKEKAMTRLLKAIENPFTTILGHPTGRLLLIREGYPIDHRKVIDACAAHGVVIELNANPYRLDLDWRWISYAVSKGVMISINPDAHSLEGYHDMHYGICVARKGGLSAGMTFNALTCREISEYFAKRKSRKN